VEPYKPIHHRKKEGKTKMIKKDLTSRKFLYNPTALLIFNLIDDGTTAIAIFRKLNVSINYPYIFLTLKKFNILELITQEKVGRIVLINLTEKGKAVQQNTKQFSKNLK
jgi:hypothetical protein